MAQVAIPLIYQSSLFEIAFYFTICFLCFLAFVSFSVALTKCPFLWKAKGGKERTGNKGTYCERNEKERERDGKGKRIGKAEGHEKGYIEERKEREG